MAKKEHLKKLFKNTAPRVLLLMAFLGIAYVVGLLRVGGETNLSTIHYEPIEGHLSFLFCPEFGTANFSWQDGMFLEVRRWQAPDGADLWYAGDLTADDRLVSDPITIIEDSDRTPPEGRGFADPIDAALSLLHEMGYDATVQQLFPVHSYDIIASATDALQDYLRKTRPYRFSTVESVTYNAKAYYAARENQENKDWLLENTILLQTCFKATLHPSLLRKGPQGTYSFLLTRNDANSPWRVMNTWSDMLFSIQ